MSKTGTDTAYVDFVLHGFSPLFQLLRPVACERFQSCSKRPVITVLTGALGFLLAARGAHGKRKPAPHCATANEVSAALQVRYVVFACAGTVFGGGMSAYKVSQETQTEANK